MLKKVAIGAAALMVLASAVAYAQQPPDQADGGWRFHFSAEDRAAFLDARVAALHAGLKLSPDQEKLWPAFEQAFRELAAVRAKRMQGFHQFAMMRREHMNEARGDEQGSADPIQQAERAAAALGERSAALKHYADAGAPLYQRLDDSQKARFVVLSHAVRQHFGRFGFGNSERGERDSFHPMH